ncbi:MAG: DinB family protein [Dehalococcoidia bacterium]
MATREEYARQPLAQRLERLARTPDDLAEAIHDQDDAALSRRPDGEHWSAKEIVCHIRDIEEQFILRFRTMLAMDEPKFLTLGDMPLDRAAWGLEVDDGLPLDPDRWAYERQYLRQDTTAALAAFRVRREETLVFLRRIAPAQLQRGSIHTTLGRLTIDDWVALIGAHDDKHLDQLRHTLPWIEDGQRTTR